MNVGHDLPLQFATLCGVQEVFVWSDCPLDLGTEVRAVIDTQIK